MIFIDVIDVTLGAKGHWLGTVEALVALPY